MYIYYIMFQVDDFNDNDIMTYDNPGPLFALGHAHMERYFDSAGLNK
jgi:hypothetical protein